MTRYAGQISGRRTLAGAAVLAVAAVAIVVGLEALLDREGRLPPLGAPAEDVAEEPCPDPQRPPIADPLDVTADRLIECPTAFDGRLVRYRGEAVRAVLPRGERAWLQLNDDPYALTLGPLPAHRTAVGGNSGIPVSIPSRIASQIQHVGDARTRGDLIEVVGTFHRADAEDAGGPAIQAESAEVLRPGEPVTRPRSRARAAVAAAVALAAVVAAALARWRPAEVR